MGVFSTRAGIALGGADKRRRDLLGAKPARERGGLRGLAELVKVDARLAANRVQLQADRGAVCIPVAVLKHARGRVGLRAWDGGKVGLREQGPDRRGDSANAAVGGGGLESDLSGGVHDSDTVRRRGPDINTPIVNGL